MTLWYGWYGLAAISTYKCFRSGQVAAHTRTRPYNGSEQINSSDTAVCALILCPDTASNGYHPELVAKPIAGSAGGCIWTLSIWLGYDRGYCFLLLTKARRSMIHLISRFLARLVNVACDVPLPSTLLLLTTGAKGSVWVLLFIVSTTLSGTVTRSDLVFC